MEASPLPGINRYRISEILATISRLGLAAVFLYAAVPKLLDWPGFSEAVARYHMLPAAITPLFALLLASLELVLGFLLLAGIYTSLSAWFTIGLNVMFIIAMGQAIIRGIDTSCGCFAASEKPLGFQDILRDLVFIAMAGLVLWRTNESSKHTDTST